MVSILEGRLARTWIYKLNGEKDQIITLFHDTITGLRSALLNYHEISNSFGNSALLNLLDGSGHKIPFVIKLESRSIPG